MISDVIAAIATPPGRSAIALIRVSGRGAHETVSAVLTPFSVDPVRAARLSKAVHPVSGECLDEALYVVYSAPSSYTGEDMVEISTHGGVLVPVEVFGALLAAGARQAAPGEFTRRALANGKLDLLQAEAIADLSAATAPAQRRAALGQLDRALSARIGELRDQVLELEALCCYEIDFPEEDSGPVPPERIAAAIGRAEQALAELLATAAEGRRLQEGAICVIAGRPNAGKSSLFNALLGHERAIVTEIPGTTRDAIEAAVTCDGYPFRLVDTAGLHQSDDTVERLGVEVSHRYLDAADVILLCVEASQELTLEEREALAVPEVPTLLVRTKSDLPLPRSPAGSEEGLSTSAVTGDGIAALRRKLAVTAFSGVASRSETDHLVTRERHRLALDRALSEIRAFRRARTDACDIVVAATHLRAAVSDLDEIIGVVTNEEVLERVFASFCIGK
jgi:tRNA modification GTPase